MLSDEIIFNNDGNSDFIKCLSEFKIKNSIPIISIAWKNVTKQCIQNCFNHVKKILSDNEVNLLKESQNKLDSPPVYDTVDLEEENFFNSLKSIKVFSN